MSRPTTWKEIHFTSHDDMNKLQSYQGSSAGAWKEWIIVWEDGVGFLETNLPWSELRAWFSFSGVTMPVHYLTSDHPSWSEYCTCGMGMAAPHKHLKTCDAF